MVALGQGKVLRSPDKCWGNRNLGTEDAEENFAQPGRQQPTGCPCITPKQPQKGLTFATGLEMQIEPRAEGMGWDLDGTGDSSPAYANPTVP